MKRILFGAALAAAVLSGCSDGSFEAPVGKTPTMGWSSWNTFMLDINEQLIREQADALVEGGFAELGYNFINIDDGFQIPRDSAGHFRYNENLFPSGMRALADYIHSKGLKAGIYTDAGDNTCGSENRYEYGLGVGLYGHETEDCRLFFDDWDYDFIKIDFCGGQHAALDEKAQYLRIAEAISSCEKEDIDLNVCRWVYPGTWIGDIALSWRTTYDIRPWWDRLLYIIKENLWIQAYTGGGHYNDMDMLEIGAKWQGDDRILTPDEERTHMAYWCIASSPLLIGCDLRSIPQSSLEILKNADLLAMNQDCLGLGAPVVQREGDVYVVAKDMERIMGPKRAVVVMNLGDSEAEIDVSTEALGFAGKVGVYDCFTHCEDSSLTGAMQTMRVKVAPHGSNAYFVTGKRVVKSVYQAEEAFLGAYTEIEGKESPAYSESASADMGMCVTGLGGSADNWLEWRNVYSRGGKGVITLRYAGKVPSDVIVSVNGTDVQTFKELVTGASIDCWKENVSVTVELAKGLNTIRLHNPGGPMPAIDRMVIR
ncbi:MAG: alpha-galactosidase [Bacteroidales bacterium]|nr:alpha-galactosidase [Bacteroidales bacterium]